MLAGGAALGLGACGGSGMASELIRSVSRSAAAAAAVGGRLRVGVGGSTDESLNPFAIYSAADRVRINALLEPLAELRDGRITRVLAEELEPNADATVWTIRVREGATFHDGKPVTAADVAYSLTKAATDPESENVQLLEDLDTANIRVLDARTLEVPLTRPRGDFELLLSFSGYVVPEGATDFGMPVGSGPFRFVSYAPGETAVLAAYAGYWGGPPLIDELEVHTISDATARLNALKAGQIDYAADITPIAARAEAANPDLEIFRGGAANSATLGLAMNVGIAPFDDPRVRRAFRLAADRTAILNGTLFGFGEIGNDLIGKGLPGYNADLPQREQDLDQARSLLSDAGVGDLELSILVAPVVAGVVEGVQIFVEQLKEIGVRATIEQLPIDVYYSDAARVASAPIQVSSFLNRPAMLHFAAFVVSSALVNPTEWRRPEFDARSAEAQATADPDRQAAILAELQRQLYDEGGDLVWAFAETLAAARAGLTGVSYSSSTPVFGQASLE